MQRKEFFKKLADIYPKVPPETALQQYADKLSVWKVSAKQLDSFYEGITESCEFFPTIAQFTTVAGESGIRISKKPKDAHFLAFDLNGLRTVVKVKDPSDPPFIKAASNIHMVIAPGKEVEYESVDFAEGILAAREAYLESGGPVGKWLAIEHMLRTKLPPLQAKAYAPVTQDYADDDDPFAVERVSQEA